MKQRRPITVLTDCEWRELGSVDGNNGEPPRHRENEDYMRGYMSILAEPPPEPMPEPEPEEWL